MIEQPKKRARLQVHLSTAIILMFAAGALMWANIRLQIVTTYYDEFHRRFEPNWHEEARGWPFRFIDFQYEYVGLFSLRGCFKSLISHLFHADTD